MKVLNKVLMMMIAVGIVGCGAVSNTSESNSDREAEKDKEVKVSIQVKYKEKQETGFALVSADSYNAEISGCLSGYTKSLTMANSSVNVQNTDRNCLFKINSLVFHGETFTPAGGQDWTTGQSFNVTGGAGTRLNFKVVSNIATPISGAQTVTVQFGYAEEGISQTVAAGVSTGISVTGADPIDLEIVALAVTVDSGDGAGLFNFTLECADPVASGACNGVATGTLKAGLALDASGGADLTLDECKTIAAGGSTGTSFAAGANPSYPNGGLTTGNRKGPATLYAAANDELIMAVSKGGTTDGCKYYRVTIQAP